MMLRVKLLCLGFVLGIVPASSHALWKTDGISWNKHLWVGHHENPGHQTVSALSQESVAKEEKKPWTPGEKKSNPFGEVMFGIFLWTIIPVCLWNNERIAIKQYKMQFKAERWAIHIDEPEREPLKEMDGRIVYISGVSKCDESLADSEFPQVKSEGKIKLRRNFEMYQWVEHEKEEGDGDNKRTVYYYTKEWSDKQEQCPNDSSGQHQNPSLPFPSTRRQQPYRAFYDVQAGNGVPCAEAKHENVRVGAYYLGELVLRGS